MNNSSHSLAEVAAIYIPELKLGTLWLHRRIKSGEIPGYRVGRTYRMTDEHINQWMTAPQRNTTPAPGGVAVPTPAAPPVSIIDGLSAGSRRRLARIK